MDDSIELFDLFSGMTTSEDSNGMRCLTIYLERTITQGDTIISFVRVNVLHPAQMI